MKYRPASTGESISAASEAVANCTLERLAPAGAAFASAELAGSAVPKFQPSGSFRLALIRTGLPMSCRRRHPGTLALRIKQKLVPVDHGDLVRCGCAFGEDAAAGVSMGET